MNNRPPPTPPCQVRVENKLLGTKFGTLKKPMFSLFDVIIFFLIKQSILGTTSSEQYLK